MPDQLVSAGGSRGATIVGEEYNSNLTNRMLNIANDLAAEGIQAARSKQYIEGKARVAQGETQRSIRAEQGVLDKIFGNATLQGAAAQEVIKAGDANVLNIQENMQELRKLSTEDFVAKQTRFVTENLLTGNPETDQLITLTASDSISQAARIHAKEHAVYKQVRGRLAFESSVTSAAKVLASSSNADEITVNTKILSDRLKQQPGQHFEGYLSSITDLIKSELDQGRDSVYNLTKDMQFDAATQASIQEHYLKYQDKFNLDKKLKEGLSIAQLTAESNDPSIGYTDLVSKVTDSIRANVPLSSDDIARLFINKSKVDTKLKKFQSNVTTVSSGGAFTNKADQALALDDFNAAVLNQVDKVNTPELKKQAERQAKNLIVQKSLQYNNVANSTTTRLNTNLANLQIQDGTTKRSNPEFVAAYQELLEVESIGGKEADTLYKSKLDNVSLGNITAVRSLMEYNPGIELDEAIRRAADSKMTSEEASKAIDDNIEVRKLINSITDDPDGMPWYKEMFFGKYSDKVAGLPKVANSFRMMLTSQMRESGRVNISAAKATYVKWSQLNEEIQGDIFYNHGKSFSTRAGLISPNTTYQEALDFYVGSKGKEIFGEGFDADNGYSVNLTDKFITIQPLDVDGLPIAGLKNASTPIRHEVIGTYYNTFVTAAKEAAIETARATDISEFSNAIAENPLSFTDYLGKYARVLGEGADKDILGLIKLNTDINNKVIEIIENHRDKTGRDTSGFTQYGFSGEALIDSTVSKVEEVLGGTKGLLKRTAQVESNFGKHRNTYTNKSNGIWQVDDIGLADTQDTASHPNLTAIHALIKDKFNIDWNEVKPDDLVDPLYGAIAARLVYLNVAEGIPSTKEEQAIYWKKYYNRSGKGTTAKFINRTN